jgi:nuclear GTP-binding protein
MKVGKPQSKRVPVRLRHKIQKASAAKQKKQRKDAKKNPQWRSRLKKDPGIPNLFPYKAKILAEVEENKRKKEEEIQRRREVAKAQRNGTTAGVVEVQPDTVDEDEELLDEASDDEDAMDEQDESSNPMAALLASAQARAQTFAPEDEDDLASNGEDEEWEGIDEDAPARGPSAKKSLPKQALADPVKAVSALLDRMKETTDGIQTLIDHYQLPPLVTANSDTTSSFLVEVARKRGRLGRGGVPNLHSAALTVLSDLNEEKLVLPSTVTASSSKAVSVGSKGSVQIVSQLAEPFRIEGLFGDDIGGGVAVQEDMVVEI